MPLHPTVEPTCLNNQLYFLNNQLWFLVKHCYIVYFLQYYQGEYAGDFGILIPVFFDFFINTLQNALKKTNFSWLVSLKHHELALIGCGRRPLLLISCKSKQKKQAFFLCSALSSVRCPYRLRTPSAFWKKAGQKTFHTRSACVTRLQSSYPISVTLLLTTKYSIVNRNVSETSCL